MASRKILTTFTVVLILASAFYVKSISTIYPTKITGGVFNSKGEFNSTALVLTKNGDGYLWVSNNNTPLDHIVVRSHAENGKENIFSYFINPEGKGFIIIKHEDTFEKNSSDTHIVKNNFTIYLQNEHGYATTSGSTSPYPFPKSR